ncbi:WRKY domain-containing protein [Tanacetum coccineum]|uniref:WRKY domain-containing protein n=1 Tax=Tanacetum coccineum TaxID=301880 RepID=A0ABQ4XC48_9ASTR
MQSLTELIVEDCPKVNCLVNMEDVTPGSSGPFLLNLRRVSLIDLPELVSISGGIRIAPQLDTLLVFNCMKLDYLSIMELPRNVKAIKGEIEWWDALKYGKMTWNNVFVKLTRDGGLMDILAQDTNSLQHFLELDAVPSHPTSPMQVDQISSRDHVDQFQIKHDVPSSNESQKMSPQEILNTNKAVQSQYAEAGFGMWEPPYPVIRKPHNEDMDYDFKALNDKRAFMKKKRSSISIITSKHQVRVNKGIEVEKALDDGYIWRKYGQKKVLGCEYPRTIASPNRSTSDIEDAFSSMNILNYTSVSSDYFPASSRSISFNSSEDSNIILSVILPFYNNPYLKDVQAFYAKESPISPPDPITLPAILTPSPVLPPSLLFDPRYFFFLKNYYHLRNESVPHLLPQLRYLIHLGIKLVIWYHHLPQFILLPHLRY